MKKNYYEEKISYIESLIKNKKYKKANQEILNELNLPYVPKIYEDIFNSMFEQIKEYSENNFSKTISKDVAIDYLISNDEKKETIAIELLRKHNLHHDKEIIKKRIETWNLNKTILKAYLFEILVEQNINIDINLNGIILNPAKFGSILDKKEVQKTILEIEKIFIKNPSWKELAINEFHKFLLFTYPAVPVKPKEFAYDIAKIIESHFDKKTSLTIKQQRIKNILSS